MGTRCAPNYAIIFMAELEEQFLTTLTLKPRILKRFIDDIFIIWNHGESELEHLLIIIIIIIIYFLSTRFTDNSRFLQVCSWIYISCGATHFICYSCTVKRRIIVRPSRSVHHNG